MMTGAKGLPKVSNPHSLLAQMISDFSTACNDLFSITGNGEIFQGDKALYGKMIVKPSKRVARLMTIDRELLVLFTSFEEQQVRTISQAKKLIEELHSRVEPTIAIVVHRDQNANNNLKKWGRENGISILPVYYIDDKFPQGEELEKVLLGEQYSHDPFDITGPVSGDSQFYGRRTEAQDLARKLSSGQIRSCLGIRKTGKTSLLNRVISELTNAHNAICLVVDCSKDSIWNSDAISLLNAISLSIGHCIQNNIPYHSLNEIVSCRNNMATICQQLGAEIMRSTYPIVILFDEVDYITPSSPTSQTWKDDFNVFWRNFRSVYQDNKRQADNLGVFVCGVSSKWFTVESINNVENAALSFIPEEYLSPLARGASTSMIKTLARTSGLIVDDNVSSYIAGFTSDIPFWTRKACSFIHRQIDIDGRPIQIELNTTKRLLNNFLDTEGAILAQVALSHLFRVFPEFKEVVVKCYTKKMDNLPPSLISKIPQYGIAVKQADSFAFGSMMNSGLKNIISESINTTAINHPEPVEQKQYFDSSTEWAEELALLGKNRNLLEKKLRGICLNFIRFDALSNKTKGMLNDRLLKIVEESNRKSFKDLTGEQIVEKFLWTELSNLIKKEWGLFERLFNDKNEFALHSSIINERPDAHAKDYQMEDVALYKRALKWFEDKIRVNS